eukprot:EG_transcript_9138
MRSPVALLLLLIVLVAADLALRLHALATTAAVPPPPPGPAGALPPAGPPPWLGNRSAVQRLRRRPPGDSTAGNTSFNPTVLQQFEAAWRAAHPDKFDVPHWETRPGVEHIRQQMEADFQNIAVVYTWVNVSDPRDIARRAALRPGPDGTAALCREDLQLRYSMRSYEQYMAWHRGPVYLVTPGYWPTWLNRSHPRLVLVDQATLVDTGGRPFFNSNVLELHFDRLPGLPAHFIHLNDDYLLQRPTHPRHFFLPGGAVRLFMGPGLAMWTTQTLRDRGIIVKAHWRAATARSWDLVEAAFGPVPRYILKHSPFAYHTAAFPLLRALWADAVAETVTHPFRNFADVIAPLLHHAFVLHRGAKHGLQGVMPAVSELTTAHRYLSFKGGPDRLRLDLGALANVLFLTVNGKCSSAETRTLFYNWLERRYPEPSSFELPGV